MKKVKDFKPTYRIDGECLKHTRLDRSRLCLQREFTSFLNKEIKENRIDIEYNYSNEDCLVCSIRRNQLDIQKFNPYSIGKK